MQSKTDSIETSGLKIGVIVNFIMALAGWLAYSITNSEALLLDGNFSFISTLTTIGAIIIIKKRHTKTKLFPYGRYFFESFFTLFKGILILGLTITALFQNVIKIIDFANGESMDTLKTGPILIYMGLMLVLCFGVAFIYQSKNKSINYLSPILSVEAKSSKIDGYMTIAVGAALILTTIVPESSSFSFLLYIGDSIIVILMCLFLLKIPFQVIKHAFIEIGGGVLQDKETGELIDKIIHKLIPDGFVFDNRYVTKNGSSYLIIIYVKPIKENILVSQINSYREMVYKSLVGNYPNLEVEIIVHD